MLLHHVSEGVWEENGCRSFQLSRDKTRSELFSFHPQMTILIRAVLWEYDNGAEAINLDLKRSALPSSVVK